MSSTHDAPPNPPGNEPPLVSWWWRGCYVVLGVLFLAIGFLGAYLPVLPTTPFLLLATYFLARSWPALNRRVHRLPVFGTYLREWDEHRGVRLEIKWWASGVALVSAGGGLWFGGAAGWVQGLVAGLVIAGLVVVWSLPTIHTAGKKR
ncbi:MAG: YbaN family protein [Pirellulaceae bacterium]|nr:YbaN family protein [Pirellulaceae bacterium]